MKRTMDIQELPAIDDPRKPVKAILTVRGPGIVRQTSVMAKPMKVSVITSVTGKSSPQMELIPVIIFEIDPDAEKRDRAFIVIPPGTTIEVSDDKRLEYRGSFMYPQGAIFFMFEECEAGCGSE